MIELDPPLSKRGRTNITRETDTRLREGTTERDKDTRTQAHTRRPTRRSRRNKDPGRLRVSTGTLFRTESVLSKRRGYASIWLVRTTCKATVVATTSGYVLPQSLNGVFRCYSCANTANCMVPSQCVTRCGHGLNTAPLLRPLTHFVSPLFGQTDATERRLTPQRVLSFYADSQRRRCCTPPFFMGAPRRERLPKNQTYSIDPISHTVSSDVHVTTLPLPVMYRHAVELEVRC